MCATVVQISTFQKKVREKASDLGPFFSEELSFFFNSFTQSWTWGSSDRCASALADGEVREGVEGSRAAGLRGKEI